MGKTFAAIDDHLRKWIGERELFFVATAPLAADGHVNCSPKGPMGTFRVLDEQTVAYLDLIGSGAETIAHLRENGRVVVMFCAFQGPPRILRLHGRGRVVQAADPEFEELFERCAFNGDEVEESRRGIVVITVERIADSCGYGVPLMTYEGEREHMRKWAEKKLRAGGDEALVEYQREKNTESIDGLPAVEV